MIPMRPCPYDHAHAQAATLCGVVHGPSRITQLAPPDDYVLGEYDHVLLLAPDASATSPDLAILAAQPVSGWVGAVTSADVHIGRRLA